MNPTIPQPSRLRVFAAGVKKLTLLLTLLSVLALHLPLFAADVYWDNPGAGDWFDEGNWQGGALPGASDNVYINDNGTALISSGSTENNNLYLNNASSLTVSGTAQYNVGLYRTVYLNDTSHLTVTGSSYLDFGYLMGIYNASTVTVSGNGQLVGRSGIDIYDNATMHVTDNAQVGTVYLHSGTFIIDSAGASVDYLSIRSGAMIAQNQTSAINVELSLENNFTVSGSTWLAATGYTGISHSLEIKDSTFLQVTAGSTPYNNLVAIGAYDAGSVTISDSGSMSTSVVTYIGNGRIGAVTVSGSGRWDAQGDISIGGGYGVSSGTGSLTITDNAYVSTSFGIDIGYGGATVTVSGSGRVDAWLNVGDSGTGTLIIKDDAKATGGGRIGTGGIGVVTISDNGRWEFGSDPLTIGDSGTGTLNLNGGTVQARDLLLGVYQYSSAYPSVGTLVIGGDGSGKLVGTDGTSAMAITTDNTGTGTVRFTHTGDIEFANTISGSTISVEHDGPGVTTLTADSAIKNLSVTGGALNIDENTTVTLQSGNATVSNGGRLGGAGTLGGGPLTVEAGGQLDTTLTLSDGLTLEASAILGYADGDGLLVTGGAITIGDGIIIDFSALTELGEHTVLDWSGATGGESISGEQFTVTGEGIEGTFSVANNQLTFNATAVPEPSTWFLIGAGLGALALIRRRSS
ncbi:MAG: PEP-CTERM sorting domain-containing protein [Verrucomicrobiales bacterium]|nr:PEP-CTERM sorting domain-containing protein [Verrucomicrobiales bacterium]